MLGSMVQVSAPLLGRSRSGHALPSRVHFATGYDTVHDMQSDGLQKKHTETRPVKSPKIIKRNVNKFLTISTQLSVVHIDANVVGCYTGAVQATSNRMNRLLQNSCLSTGIFFVSLLSSMEVCG